MIRSRRTALFTACLVSFSAAALGCEAGSPESLTATVSRDRTRRSVADPSVPALQPSRFVAPPKLVGAGGPAPALESTTCEPVSSVTLELDEPFDIVGSTRGAHDTHKTYCADPSDATSAPDRVMTIEIPEDCTLTVTMESSEGFDGAFQLQTGCADKGAQLGCINGQYGSTLLRGVAAGTYYLVVDGMNGTSGDFTLHATCAAPLCGDGALNAATEACDGGLDPLLGDGCTDAGEENGCEIESVGAADTCAATSPFEVAISSPATLPSGVVPYTTIGAGSDHEGDEALFWPAVDEVFEFVPLETGTLRIRIGLDANGSPFCANDWSSPGCWNHVLYAREEACDAPNIQLSYPNFITDDGVNELYFAVDAGKSYFVFVDGFDMTEFDAGPYYLDVSLLPQ